MPTFKPDSSFFRKIAIGAVGTRAVCEDLNQHQHTMADLSGVQRIQSCGRTLNASASASLILCARLAACGLRVAPRASRNCQCRIAPLKTERSWDFGMVDTDVVAFPVCGAVGEQYWSRGKLNEDASYWHERNWVKWKAEQHVNYFSVSAFEPHRL